MAWKPWLKGGTILILAGGICTEEGGGKKVGERYPGCMHITLLEG